jgi:Transglycosylase-like domain
MTPRTRTRLVATALLLTVIVAFVIAVRADPRPKLPPKPAPEPDPLPWQLADLELTAAHAQIRRLQRTVRAQRRQLHKQRTNFRRAFRSDPYGRHWLENAFLCIHQGEGAWWSNTGNGYYGGLQMDRAFQRAYGPEFLRAFGTADRWPASVQLAVGIRGYLARGFHPWPNTARRCGLL